jgi:Tol biopolymer transport system component
MRAAAPAVAMVLVLCCGAPPVGAPRGPGPPEFTHITNLAALNSQDFDGGPSISADELSLYFVTDRDVSTGGDIWVANRTSTNQPFGPPRSLGSPVNSAMDEGAPSISGDGLELYFDRSPAGRIFVATRAGASLPFGIPVEVNLANTACCDGFPDISADGLDLYFCSSRSGGYGGDDVWLASRPTRSSPFGAPVDIGTGINSPADECDPGVSKDGLTLFFASNRNGGAGGMDVWMASRSGKDAIFSRSRNLGPGVNTGFSDERPDISPDGATLYLMSDRHDGLGSFDLWEARVGGA